MIYPSSSHPKLGWFSHSLWVKSKLLANFYYANFYLAEVTPAPANLEASVTVTQNQSLSETDKSDKELEQEEEEVEDVKPHLTPGSNVTYSDEKATDAPLASSSHVNASSVLYSAVPTNSTSSSTATTTLTSSLVNQSKSCHSTGYYSIRYYGSNLISG